MAGEVKPPSPLTVTIVDADGDSALLHNDKWSGLLIQNNIVLGRGAADVPTEEYPESWYWVHIFFGQPYSTIYKVEIASIDSLWARIGVRDTILLYPSRPYRIEIVSASRTEIKEITHPAWCR
jgi:hypothetical protein